MCPSEHVEYVEANGNSNVEPENGAPHFTIKAVAREGGPRIMVEPLVSLPMQLDTGASVSIISQDTLTKFLPTTQSKPSDIILKTFRRAFEGCRGS